MTLRKQRVSARRAMLITCRTFKASWRSIEEREVRPPESQKPRRANLLKLLWMIPVITAGPTCLTVAVNRNDRFNTNILHIIQPRFSRLNLTPPFNSCWCRVSETTWRSMTNARSAMETSSDPVGLDATGSCLTRQTPIRQDSVQCAETPCALFFS